MSGRAGTECVTVTPQSPRSSPLRPLPQPGLGRAGWRPVPDSRTFCSWHVSTRQRQSAGGVAVRNREGPQRSGQSGALSSITQVPINLKGKENLTLVSCWVERRVLPLPLAPSLDIHGAQAGPPEGEGCPVPGVGWGLCPTQGLPAAQPLTLPPLPMTHEADPRSLQDPRDDSSVGEPESVLAKHMAWGASPAGFESCLCHFLST